MTWNQINSSNMNPESLRPQECGQETYLLRAFVMTPVTLRRGSMMQKHDIKEQVEHWIKCLREM